MHLFIFMRQKRDPNLLRDEEVILSEKYVIYTSDMLVKVSPLSLLYLTELTKINRIIE